MLTLLRFIAQKLRQHVGAIVGYSLLAVFTAGLDTLAPVLMGRGLDAAKDGGAFLAVVALLSGWFLLRVLSDRLRGAISERGMGVASVVAEAEVRHVLAGFLDKPLAFHYGKKSHESADKVMRLRWDLENVIFGIVFDLWPALLAILGILGYVAFLDWRIALVLLAAIAAFMAYTRASLPKVLASREAWSKADRKASSFGWDSLRNALVVKSTTNEALVVSRMEQYSREARPLIDADNKMDRQIGVTQNVIISAGSFAAVLLAVANFHAGTFTFGMVTTIMAYAFAIFGYVRYCQWQFRAILRTTATLNEVEALKAEPSEDFASGAPLDVVGGVEFRNVRFRYREDKATLEDVSFSVKAGQRVAIVGESGEGKTTLVDLLGRYYEPQAGSVLVDGRDAEAVNLRSLREQMAYVPQDLTLFHETLGFNIRYGRPDASDEEVAEAVRFASMDAFVAGLPDGLETMVGERGLKLSGGERQRVALARAFLRKPKIIVLDEPTAHLDSKTEEVVRASLDQLMKGRTTFIIAHRLKTVQDADLILVLKDGRIAESGRHAELVALGGAYAALLRAQGGFIAPGEAHLGDEAVG